MHQKIRQYSFQIYAAFTRRFATRGGQRRPPLHFLTFKLVSAG